MESKTVKTNSKEIIKIRNGLNKTVRQMSAEILGQEISLRTYSKMEKGTEEISLKKIEQFVSLINIFYKKNKINKTIDISEIVIELIKPINRILELSKINTINIGEVLSSYILKNKRWEKNEKIIKYLCNINDKNSEPITSFFTSLNSLSKIRSKVFNSWDSSTEEQLENEISTPSFFTRKP